MAARGGIVVVSGVPASGKTALLQAFLRVAVDAGVEVLDAVASLQERTQPLGVVSELVPDEFVANATTMTALASFRNVVLEMAGSGPLVIVVDDVHHSDLPSLECLVHTARRVRSARVLMVFAETTRLPREYLTFKAELSSMPHCRQ